MVEPLAIIGAAAAVYTMLKPKAASPEDVKQIVQEIIQDVPPEQRDALAQDPEAIKDLVSDRLSSTVVVQQKPGQAFRVKWSWSLLGPGSARVGVTLTPTISGRSLKVSARLPEGVTIQKGSFERVVDSPAADVPVAIASQVTFDPDVSPVIYVNVTLDIADDHKSSATIVVRDPKVPLPTPEEASGDVTYIGGFPAKVVGEMARSPEYKQDPEATQSLIERLKEQGWVEPIHK